GVDVKKISVQKVAHRTRHERKIEAVDSPDPEKSESTEEVSVQASIPQPTRSVSFMWPLHGRITSGFGNRPDPFSGKRSFHNGVDISAEQGTPVKACADGEVIYSGWKEGYGNLVVVKHINGYVSVYGHNSVLKKEEGDIVKKGDVISLSGMTGAVTGAHLHFEIQKYQTPLNPIRMLK
ncbi:MAG TPA: M23 family metallopeptidase, partial [Spirochaetota bacterium]